VVDSCEHGSEPLGFIKGGEFLDSQEVLSSMELVISSGSLLIAINRKENTDVAWLPCWITFD
jgi:hypothetical protein